MAVYFDHKIQPPSVGTQTGIAWHKNHALLAVASKHDPDIAGSVNLYLDEVRFRVVRVKFLLLNRLNLVIRECQRHFYYINTCEAHTVKFLDPFSGF